MAARRRRKTIEAAPAEDFELSGQPLRLVSFEVQNILGVKAAYVDASGKHVVVIGGKNGQGKTSLLKALEMAIAGKKSFPLDPIHHGAHSGSVQVDLGEIKVELTISNSGNRLIVSSPSGGRIKSPQQLLNTLFSELSFDPLRFAYMEPSKQDAELKRIGGVEDAWAKLEQEKDEVFGDRTEDNREVKRYTAQLEGMPWHEDAPDEERSSRELIEELNVTREQKRQNDEARSAADAASNLVAESTNSMHEQAETIRDLEQELKLAREKMTRMQESHSELLTEEARLAEKVQSLQDPDIASKEEELACLDERNRKFRENSDRKRIKKHLDDSEAESKRKTERLRAIEDEKAQLLANARFPIDGLGFGELGPTFKGVPLEQIARSELVRLSCSIGFAQNPRLRLLIVKDAAFLDEDGMRLMEELAEEHDGLVILERVGTGDPLAIVIEDGCVREEATAAE